MAEWETEKKKNNVGKFIYFCQHDFMAMAGKFMIYCVRYCLLFSRCSHVFVFIFIFSLFPLPFSLFFHCKEYNIRSRRHFHFFLCLVQRNSICMMNLNNKKIKTFPIKFFCNYSQVYSIQSVKRRYKYRTLKRTRIALCHRM